MLLSARTLKGHGLVASDGEIGTVREIYFDDQRWVVRHLVVDTGGWLSNRAVLVSPHAVQGIDAEARQIRVALKRQQVKDAPGIDADRPVSRQHEQAAYDHYGYPYYWGGTGLWGAMDMPMGGVIAPFTGTGTGTGETATAATAAARDAAAHDATPPDGDPTLRSSAEVLGYAAAAQDGDIGDVDDLQLDPRSWQIALLVIDTGRWLPGRRVTIPPRWVRQVDWAGRRVELRVPRQAVESSPEPPASQPPGLDQTRRIQMHFERWE